METNLVCYAWEVAKRLPDNDSITENGVKILRECLSKGLSVTDAAIELASEDQTLLPLCSNDCKATSLAAVRR